MPTLLGSFLPAERGMDLLTKVGAIERSVSYLEKQVQGIDENVEALRLQLDGLRLEFASAKGSLRVLVWTTGIAGTILVSLIGFIVYVAEQVARHYLHW